MKIASVRNFVVRGKPVKMAVVADDTPKAVVILARRDLIFLQRLFRRLDIQDEFASRVTELLTEITRERD